MTRAEQARRAADAWLDRVGVHVVIVDLEPPPDSFIAGLAADGISTHWCADVGEALVEFGRSQAELVLVAGTVPGDAASALVRTLVKCGARVFVAIEPLQAAFGADLVREGASAVVKHPYSEREVMARLAELAPDLDAKATIHWREIELDPRAFEVRVAGRALARLPLKEFELLRLLLLRAESVVATEEIRRTLWGEGIRVPGSNAIAVHAARLRTRLVDTAEVQRVRGTGYRLMPPRRSRASGPRDPA